MSLERTIEHLENLVAIESVSGNEAEALNYVYDSLGRLSHVSIEHADENGVVGLIKGQDYGQDGANALMLQGHADTVPLTKGWKTNPKVLEKNNGILTGWGVSDDKVAVAQNLAMAEQYERPPISLVVEAVALEELDGSGTWALQGVNSELAAKFYRCACLLGEPTDASFFGVRHIPAIKAKVIAEGEGGHGAKDMKGLVPASKRLGRLLVDLESIQNDWTEKYYSKKFGKPTINATGQFTTGDVETNQQAPVIETSLDVRYTPEMREELHEIMDDLAREYGVGIEYDRDARLAEPFECPPDAYIRKLLKFLCPEMEQTVFRGATDAPGLDASGWTPVNSGAGNPNQMHKPNESVKKSSIIRHQKIIEDVIANFGRQL